MFTYKDYLDGKCSHHEYYAQLVDGSNAKGVVRSHFTIEELKEMFAKDEHLNWMPDNKYLPRRDIRVSRSLGTWDCLGERLVGVDWKKCGDYPTLSGKVSVLKCAALLIIEEEGQL